MTAPNTLAEAKQWLRVRLGQGAACPCCTQHAQVYRWSLYSTAVRALISFYKIGGVQDFVHSNQVRDKGLRLGGDVARLRFWDLVEEEKIHRPDGGRAGYWRVTQHGEDWIHGRCTVPKYAYIYNARLQRFDGPGVTVSDALKHPFDLRELDS